MPADGTPPTTRTVLDLDPSIIDPSPTQPRKHFDAKALEELTADVKAHGFIHPITVRSKGKRYELVVGERRTRAAKAAGIKVPASVRDDLDDATVLEWQLVENGDRADVHPLEEAEGYELLHTKHGRSVDDIAAKLGKSRAHVYARLKLCALVPEARKAWRDGKLSASTALYVARIPPQLQAAAVKDLEVPKWQQARDGIDQLSARAAFEIINEKYMLRLSEAPFDRGDAELVKKAGPCTTCPKRTGNQKELFADVKSADVCTDPTCFKEKRDAAWVVKKAEAEKAGQTVIEGKKAKELFPYESSVPAGFIDLDRKDYTDQKQRTHRQVLEAKKVAIPTPTLVRTEDGKVHELVPQKVAAKAAKHSTPSGPSSAHKAKQKLEDEIAKRARGAFVEAIVAKAESPKSHVAILRAAIGELEMAADDLCARRELSYAGLDALVAKSKEPQLFGILAELVACSGNSYPSDEAATSLCTALGIDHKQLRAKAAAAVKAEQAKKLAGAPSTKGMPKKDAAAVKAAAKKAPAKKKASGAKKGGKR